MTPKPRMTWTPGPTGAPVAPSLDDLLERVVEHSGPDGVRLEFGKPDTDAMPVLVAVHRTAGRPVGVLMLKWLGDAPEIINIAVHPDHQRRGIGRGLCEAVLRLGIDLRDMGAVWGPSLTAEGEALRDGLAFDRARYGFASWEKEAA